MLPAAEITQWWAGSQEQPQRKFTVIKDTTGSSWEHGVIVKNNIDKGRALLLT